MLRIGVIGTETSHLLDAGKCLHGVECTPVTDAASLTQFDALACCGAINENTQAVLGAAKSGKHLLLDLAALKSTKEAESIITACHKASVSYILTQPRRFSPAVQAIRQSLDADELGAPGLLRIHRWGCGASEELNRRLIGEIDLAIYLLQGMPTSLYAVTTNPNEGADRFVQVHLGFEGGGMALIDATTRLPEGDDYYSLSLLGANGAAYADDHHNMQLLFAGGSAEAERTRQGAREWVKPLQQFVSAIEGAQQVATGDYTALSVIDAVLQSIKTGNAMQRRGDSYEPV